MEGSYKTEMFTGYSFTSNDAPIIIINKNIKTMVSIHFSVE